MHNPQTITIERQQLTVSTIEQRYCVVHERDKLAALTRFFEMEEMDAALIFTRTKVSSSQVANELIQRGFMAEAINGDLSQDARIRVLERFRSGGIKVLVATDVAARGLDIENISHVFNYDLPIDPETYVHRVGRTGRAGRVGIAISLVNPSERSRLSRIERYTRQPLTQAQIPSEAEIRQHRENQIIEKMMVWLKRDRFKREEEIVALLIAEGHDLSKIAAAALKLARAEERQRSIEPISEVATQPAKAHSSERDDNRSQRGYGASRSKRVADNPREQRESNREVGMVRLRLPYGRIHGIHPGEIVGAIATRADIPGSSFGKILIRDQHTLIDISEEYAAHVLNRNGHYHFREYKNVTIKRA